MTRASRSEESGLFLVRLDGTIRPDRDAIEGSWWWRIAVPDRTLPDGETGPPPPTLRLGSGDQVVDLEQGSGCFLGTCGDIGGISPPELLPTVTTIERAPLSVTLGDGSGVVGWSVVISSIGQDDADEVVLGQARDTWTTTAWVSAPTKGDWLVTTSVTFDRDRGAFDGYGRLIVEEDPGTLRRARTWREPAITAGPPLGLPRRWVHVGVDSAPSWRPRKLMNGRLAPVAVHLGIEVLAAVLAWLRALDPERVLPRPGIVPDTGHDPEDLLARGPRHRW